VVITGISGFVGGHVVSLFLKDEQYKVIGTVRDKDNEAKMAELKAAFGADFDRIELRNADLLDDQSMERAIEGATYLIHIASPCYYTNKTQEELVKPAVDGTLSALKAAHKHGVKRVVITSSLSAVSVGNDPIPEYFTEESWSPVDKLQDVAIAYSLSKTLSEKAAWDYQTSLGEQAFELISICPALVVGPSFVVGGGNFHSGNFLTKLMKGEMGKTGGLIRPLVEVSNVALAHYNAIKIPEARN
jgi:nucleoside-diphosphate-sugar epimerase